MARKNQPGCPCCGPSCNAWFCGPFVTIDDPPTIGGGCTAALATIAVNADGTLGNLQLTQAGSCYDVANPAVTISAPINGGTSARATATVGGVTRVWPTDPGEGYVDPPPVTIEAPGGTGRTATATAVLGRKGSIATIILDDGGSLYQVATPAVTIPPPPGGKPAKAAASASPGVVTSLKLTDPGSGYDVANAVPPDLSLTIAGPSLTIGPVQLAYAGVSPSIGDPLLNGQGVEYCSWHGAGTYDIPATSTCPAVRGATLTATVAFDQTGGYEIQLDFGAGWLDGRGPVVWCGNFFGTPWGINCPALFGSGVNPTKLNLPVQPGRSRPYSMSVTYDFNVTLTTSYTDEAIYLFFGGDCPNGVNGNQPNVPVTFTLTEVVK